MTDSPALRTGPEELVLSVDFTRDRRIAGSRTWRSVMRLEIDRFG